MSTCNECGTETYDLDDGYVPYEGPASATKHHRERCLEVQLAQARHELGQIDDVLFDASPEFATSEVAHQIDCHADTIGLFAHRLAEHLRKINAVGEARRQRETEHL